MRVGNGYDVHRLVGGRKLILGGVEIPYHLGLLGHSDADVLLHAIMDALLGAAGLGDIGKHFPDTDPEFKGISSLVLLGRVGELLRSKGFFPNNIDAVVVAQKPRLAPFIDEMQEGIGRMLGISKYCVNVKATTTEGLGFTGTGEGISAYAVATVKEMNELNENV
ncbi:MAG: 2-C-methyl-D-erythritol 2,4-cyclodiphosphate synthase [Bacillota bacterium]